MAISENLVQVAAVEENTCGVLETFTANDVLLTYNPHRFVDGLENLIPFRRATHLNSHYLQSGNKSGFINFSHELLTSGIAGVPPTWNKLLKACGFAETINSSSVEYRLTSSGIPSLSLGFYLAGIAKKIWGARGSLQMIFFPQLPGLVSCEFQGAGYKIANASLFSPSFSSTEPAILQSIALGAGSYHLPISKLRLTLQNKLTPRPAKGTATGYLETLITDRQIFIEFDPEAVTPDTFDYFAYLQEKTQLELVISLGTAAGNTITLTSKGLVLERMRNYIRSSLWTYQANARLIPNQGNDELTISFS